MIWNGTSFQKSSVSIKEELRTKIPGTHVGNIWNSIRVRSQIFLQSNEVVKLGLIKSSAYVIRSLLDKSQKYLRVGDAARLHRMPGKWSSISHRVFYLIHPHFRRDVPLHQ